MTYVRAQIWWCQDEVCDCRQAVAERIRPHPNFSRAVQIERLASGKFFTDGEGGGTLEVQRDHLAELFDASVVL